ncbi:prim-pol domain-containing protein [Ascobolus immersus RN42]|uniref:DNA primase n=1 Tax=Ascobolus immersus RN42 TaxID=1160509 RepID=A0A3N4IFM9_ASCIM|nr:prim-pol domain-containing protein [Ascobolus immersus RN42]
MSSPHEMEHEMEIELPDGPATLNAKSHDTLGEEVLQEEVEKMETELESKKATPEVEVKKEEKKLDEMFDDDEFMDQDDAELLELERQANEQAMKKEEEQVEIKTEPSAPKPTYADDDLMLAYYSRLFPFRLLTSWLSHSPLPTPSFHNREFAFTLQNDAYLRYLSYRTSDDLRKDILRLNPSRFEIGPVYTLNPRERKAMRNNAKFKPIEKELVFDIDLTDYDPVRTCCDKANICHKCWMFITMAIKVIDVALREDFGFEHILWIYSGRRGAHAWVCDRKARLLDDQKRRAITSYLEIVKGGAQSNKHVNVRRPLHPHIARSLEILKPLFKEHILEAQDPWGASSTPHLSKLLPDAGLVSALTKKWESAARDSVQKWTDIDTVAKSGVSRSLDTKALRDAKQDVILEYMYPRLDANVSIHLNHLLKSPFVVHPGTGRVCVPIETERAEEFDPLAVPRVSELLKEIDEYEGVEAREGEVVQDWEKTGLRPYVEYFRRFVNGLMKDEMKGKREREGDSMEF